MTNIGFIGPFLEQTRRFEESKAPPALRVNYVHYDPEMHWCQPCQVFPKTAKDFLTHLHSKEHQQMQKTLESPWHEQPSNDVSVH